MRNHKWLQRAVCAVLTFVMVFSCVPLSAFATASATNGYGDVNVDGTVDVKDALLYQKYLLGMDPENFDEKYADVNSDGVIDLKDLLNIKKYLANWDITLGPGEEEPQEPEEDTPQKPEEDAPQKPEEDTPQKPEEDTPQKPEEDTPQKPEEDAPQKPEEDTPQDPAVCTVSFYDGDRLIKKLQTNNGDAPGQVPSNEQTSRSDAIFVGWYADPEFKTPFYADEPVTKDTNVYAKYAGLDNSTLTVTSFAQMDLEPDASFTVVGKGDVSGIILSPMDGSEPVELSVSGKGPYTVTAAEGFTPGASYQMTLPEGLNFVGTNGETLPSTVRTASFTIYKEMVQNLQMSDSVHYAQHRDPSTLKVGDTITFDDTIKDGDLVCFYRETNPRDRDYTTGNAYMDDPEVWFKLEAVGSRQGRLVALEESDSEKMYNVPDNFPVIGELPTEETGTLTLEKDNDGYVLDTDFYTQMVENKEDATVEKALEKLSVGDFVSIYVSTSQIENGKNVYFGKVTDINSNVITYVKSSAEEIEAAADLYIKPAVSGEDLISEEAEREIEQTVLAQLSESGFAEEAAYTLANLATKTDGFQNMEGVQMWLSDENGEPLSEEDIQLLNLGAGFELADDVKLKVELIKSGDQLHFKDKGSVQLAVGIDATFEVEAEDGKLVIDLSATFVQELAVGITADGSLVKKKILGIPIPIGVKVSASVDLLSYSGVSMDVYGYTVAEEDQKLYEKFLVVAKNPESLVDVVPKYDRFAGLIEGLETVGDVFDKIEEYEKEIELKENSETAVSYAKDLKELWELVDEMKTDKKFTQEEWKQMGEAFGKTNISKDLQEMVTLGTEMDAERYSEGLEDFLGKYCEMLQKETDWVTLVEKEIGKAEINLYGFVIYWKADFIVRADVNIAMGANLQYEVGKRYTFWFKIGLFKPQAGSSTMDLIDESFAFQFYVMGKLGLRMGIKGTAGFALGSTDLARVGLSLEIGPYVKLYGFFIYEYSRLREAGSSVWNSSENMAGAIYVDFGLYMIVSMDAEALKGRFEVEYNFMDKEFPLLEAGKKNFPYAFHYELMEDEQVLVVDEDKNSTNGICMEMPEELRSVSHCRLTGGYLNALALNMKDYYVTFSNPAFSVDNDGVITVDVPKDTRLLECDMTLTYKYGKMAFSTWDIQIVIPLVWTNLASAEISQYFTASVRVGNDDDGYEIVWSKRVRKNQEFTLPTEEELKELIGYNEKIYSSLSYPDAGKTTNIITNTSYDCAATYTDYAITVSGIQKEDGTTMSKTFHTTYGGVFDFSELETTGTSIASDEKTAKYTKFIGVTTQATVTANGQAQVIDLSQPITGKVAEAIRSGTVAAVAEYGDDSVLVTYRFAGIEAPDTTERIRRGSKSTLDIHSIVEKYDTALESITPALGPVNTATTYIVACKWVPVTEKKFKLSFEENGGKAVQNLSLFGESLIGNLPTPERENYIFDGWYEDKELTAPFTATNMPTKNITVYAKWTPEPLQLTLHVNGGNPWEEGAGKATVYYGSAYGDLPVPNRDGYGFLGWYTTKTCDEGTEVTAETIVKTIGKQTLYAKWNKLVKITGEFTYTPLESNPAYTPGVAVEIQPDEASWPVAPKDAPELKKDSFVFKFMRQGDSDYIEGYPMGAGTYDVVITRPADSYYEPFSQTITGVVTIEKIARTLGVPEIVVHGSGFNYLDVSLAEGTIEDLHPNAKIIYKADCFEDLDRFDGVDEEILLEGKGNTITSNSATETVHLYGLLNGKAYRILVSVVDDPNYQDVTADDYSMGGETKSLTLNQTWDQIAEPFELTKDVFEYTITTPGQLAYLAVLVNSTETKNYTYYDEGNVVEYYDETGKFSGYTFKLGADIDLSQYVDPKNKKGFMWESIGNGESHTAAIWEMIDQTFTRNTYARFCGVFDGNGYTISGIDGHSLFGTLGPGAHIKNVRLVDSNFDNDNYHPAASLVAIATGSEDNRILIENCYNEGTLDAVNDVDNGGIVGEAYYCDIINCVNRGSLLVFNDHGRNGNAQGGIVATASNTVISGCVNYGTIFKDTDAGGIVGILKQNSLVIDCVNYGPISGYSTGVTWYSVGNFGGIASQVYEGSKIINCANFGDITTAAKNVGGIAGTVGGSITNISGADCRIFNCVSYGKVSGIGNVGAIAGNTETYKDNVQHVYYQQYEGGPCAFGRETGSDDRNVDLSAYFFTKPSSNLSGNLNEWAGFEEYDITSWKRDKTGYGYIPERAYKTIYKD